MYLFNDLCAEYIVFFLLVYYVVTQTVFQLLNTENNKSLIKDKLR